MIDACLLPYQGHVTLIKFSTVSIGSTEQHCQDPAPTDQGKSMNILCQLVFPCTRYKIIVHF